MVDPEYKISVIVPIYNVEPYIERCLKSLYNQTLKEIEYIFIDDKSTDNSFRKIFQVMKRFPSRIKDTKIVCHYNNHGVAMARESGILRATGEYIIHCDPDDYIELNMYEIMYNKAIETNADITVCNILEENSCSKKIISYNFEGSPQRYLKQGKKNNFNYAILFNKLVKRSIIIDNNILPYKGFNFGEDLGIIIRILYFSKSIQFVNLPLYHYCKRKNSITNSPLTYEVFLSRVNLVKEISKFLIDRNMKIMASSLKFNLKTECRYFFNTKEKEDEWYNLFKECHKFIFFFKNFTIKERILWFLSLNNKFSYRLFKRVFKKI